MYGKAFESMYSGSMVGAGLNVFAVWNYVIAMTHFGVIELNPKLLHAVLGGTEQEIVQAIDFLCRPDPDSRCKLEDGRRMVREAQFQYRVINWLEYQTIKSAAGLKEYNRRKQAEYREKKKQERIVRQTRFSKKELEKVRVRNEVREGKFIAAEEDGNQDMADQIAAEDLPLSKNGDE